MPEFGKSIRIYLKDGTVTGIKIGEVVNQTIQSISCPRKRINELLSIPESKRPGIYFLFGNDDKTTKMKAYIGEAENVYDRLQNHISNKEFWNEVIFFVSKDDNLTKSHVKFLESKAVQIALQTQRYIIENSNQPQESLLPLADKDAMEEFLIYIKLLIGVLGHKLLEDVVPQNKVEQLIIPFSQESTEKQPITPENELKLYFKTKGLMGTAIITDEGLVVLENSDAALETSDKLQVGYRELRESLILDGTLKLLDYKYIFTKNQLFLSPSAAACVIAGSSRNGRDVWVNIIGQSIAKIENSKLK